MPYKETKVQRAWQKNRYQERISYFQSLKLNCGGCAHCGWNLHPEILQFHHKDKTKKDFKLSGSAVSNMSMKRLQSEINKCELICPNCHFWLHWNEKEWFTLKANLSK